VAEDRLKAWLQVPGLGSPHFTPPTLDEVIKVLEAAKIAVTDEVRHRVEELVAAITSAVEAAGGAKPPEVPSTLLVAEGRLPVNAEDGRFEWSPELAERLARPDDKQQVDYFSLNEIITVAAGSYVGRLIPPKDHVPGVDVFGQERPAGKLRGTAVKLGPGVRLASEGSHEVVATASGRVVEEHGQVRVYEVLNIPGDVDFASGSVDACVDVVVRGTVRSRFKVRTTRSLSVDRVIEAADVEVGGDISVRGGIFGQDRAARVQAGGRVTVQLLNEANVRAGGDILFNKELINSQVHTLGHLIGERGTIIGGQVYAREGLSVRVIGSEAGVLTSVAVGIEAEALRQARELERRVRELVKSATQIRQAVTPLITNLKRLVPAQRERATELLSKADEIEFQAEGMRRQAAQLQKEAAPKGTPYLRVGEAAHAGTHITIGTRETRLSNVLHGPVKIEMRKVRDVTEMVAVNQRTGSVTILLSTEVDLDSLPAERPAGTGKKDESKQPSPDGRRA
jgi:hypothetical protein